MWLSRKFFWTPLVSTHLQNLTFTLMISCSNKSIKIFTLQMVTGLSGHNGALVVRPVEEEIKHTQELALIHYLHTVATTVVTPITNLKLRTAVRIIVLLVFYFSNSILTCLILLFDTRINRIFILYISKLPIYLYYI